jgi:hypothetical protein
MNRQGPIALMVWTFAWASACGSGCQPPPCSASGTGVGTGTTLTTIISASPTQFYFDHSQEQVLVSLSAPEQCSTPSSVITVVKDADDNVLPNDSSLTSDEAGNVAVSVSFDAGNAGWYFIQSTVEPNVGLAEANVLVLKNRQGPPVAALPFGSCDTLEQTTGGIWVCSSPSAQNAGTSTQSLGVAARVAGSLVWAIADGGSVQLYGEDGGSLQPLASSGPTSPSPVDALIATPQDAITAAGNTLSWFQQDAGQIQAAGSTTLPAVLGPLSLLRSGSAVVAAGQTSPDASSASCIGEVGSETCPFTFGACAVVLGPGGLDAGSCQTILGTVLGTDGIQLWAFDIGSGQLSAYALDGGSFTFVANVALSSELAASQATSFVIQDTDNSLSTPTFAPEVDGIDVVFALYDARATVQLDGIGPAIVWESIADGGMAVFSR